MTTTHVRKEEVRLLRLFKYGVGTTRYKDRLWKPKCNFLGKEPCLSFKDKAYWCLVTLCEGYDLRKECVIVKGGQFE